jgi:hypothetical protein
MNEYKIKYHQINRTCLLDSKTETVTSNHGGIIFRSFSLLPLPALYIGVVAQLAQLEYPPAYIMRRSPVRSRQQPFTRDVSKITFWSLGACSNPEFALSLQTPVHRGQVQGEFKVWTSAQCSNCGFGCLACRNCLTPNQVYDERDMGKADKDHPVESILATAVRTGSLVLRVTVQYGRTLLLIMNHVM